MGWRVVFYGNCDCRDGEREKRVSTLVMQQSSGKINSCVRWYMSIQIGRKAEVINRLLNGGLHVRRSTLQRPQKIYQRRASPVRTVRVGDDAGVHACAPALGWAVVLRIRHLPIFGVGNRGGGKIC